MAWNVVQSKSVDNAGGTGLTITIPAFASNLTSGSKLIAWVSAAQQPSACNISTVKDSNGNSFSQILAYTVNASEHCWIYVLDTPAGDAGTKPTVTATFTGTQNGSALLVQEVTGLASGSTAAAVLDGTAGEANGSFTASGTATWGAYTSAAANEYLTGLYCDDGDGNGSSNSTPSGFTADASNLSADSNNDLRVYYKNSAGGLESIGSLSVSGGGTYDWNTVFVAFKLAAPPAAGGGPGEAVTPPGRQSPVTLGLPARPVQAPQSPPSGQATPVEALTPPGRSSPMALGLGLTAPAPAPQSPAVQQATPYPLSPPGRLSPAALGVPLTAPSPAPQGPQAGQATGYPLTPPGLQSPASLGLGLTAPSPAPQTPPAPVVPPSPGTAARTPPGLQSPASLGVPLTAPSPAPQSPAAGQATGYPLEPPGLQSPMSLGTPLSAPSPAPQSPAVQQATPYPLSPPGRLSPAAIGLPLTAPAPAPQTPAAGQATPVTEPVPPGRLSPMALSAFLPPGSAQPAPAPVVVVPPQPATPSLTPPGRMSPMALGLGLYAPSPGPQTPPVVPPPVVLAAPGQGRDDKPHLKKLLLLLE